MGQRTPRRPDLAKLTEDAVGRLEAPAAKDRLVFDGAQRGLAVRVTQAGRKTYLCQYSIVGTKRRVPLGSVDAMSLAMARQAARAIMGRVALGDDPAADRKVKAEATKAAALRERLTLAVLVEDWRRLHLSGRKPRYQAEATRALARAFAPWWQRPAERLTRGDVVPVLDKLPPAMARAVAAYGRACFAWAHKRGTIAANPFLALPVRSPAKRDRVLTDEEAAKLWRAAMMTAPPFGPIVQILMLTGQRRDEVCGMRWDELASDLAVWTVPGTRTKNGMPSVVPLPDAARTILRTRERTRGLVFPGDGGRPFGNWSKSKAALDTAAGVANWRLHDLRRTLATGLQRLGVRLEVTEAVLNHVSGTRGGIVGIYQHHDWRTEKAAALDGWAAHLLAVAADKPAADTVVPMRRQRAKA